MGLVSRIISRGLRFLDRFQLEVLTTRSEDMGPELLQETTSYEGQSLAEPR